MTSRSYTAPFAHVLWDKALLPAELQIVLQAFAEHPTWRDRDDGFYQCRMREITDLLPATLRARAREGVALDLGLPLTDQVVVTAQIMLPGHRIGVHSDRPLVGYEIARLVVLLTPDWRPEDGGVLELFATPEGAAVARIPPAYNTAFAFALHADSHHAVTRAERTRHSLVFNFWHPANTPALAAAVAQILDQPSFALLPAELDPIVADAETRLPEDLTYQASLAALVALRWGCPTEQVLLAYRLGARLCTEAPPILHLALWVARLYTEPFDLAACGRLRVTLEGAELPPELRPLGALVRGVA